MGEPAVWAVCCDAVCPGVFLQKAALRSAAVLGRYAERGRVYNWIMEGKEMKMLSLVEELEENEYPGRGIVIGVSEDGKKAVTAYFIMGRSGNSRNRIFVQEGKESGPRLLILPDWRIPALLFMRR